MPLECAPYVEYATAPNKLFELMNETDYLEMGTMLKAAADNCSEPEKLYWGACNILYPKCLLGETLPLCRETCLGE